MPLGVAQANENPHGLFAQIAAGDGDRPVLPGIDVEALPLVRARQRHRRLMHVGGHFGDQPLLPGEPVELPFAEAEKQRREPQHEDEKDPDQRPPSASKGGRSKPGGTHGSRPLGAS